MEAVHLAMVVQPSSLEVVVGAVDKQERHHAY